MIHFKGMNEPFCFDEREETVDTNWLDTVGVYGTSLGFDEITILPRVDKTRLVLTPISSYKNCNTKCEYCLERFFLNNYPTAYAYTSPLSPDQIIEKIILYKPSIVELTSGELLQEQNAPQLDILFEKLNQIDPHKKITLEITSNGKDTKTIKKYFQDERIHIQLSIDQDEINPRHISGTDVLTTLNELSKIDKSRIKVMWMIRADYDRESFRKNYPVILEQAPNILLQPINTMPDFYHSDAQYDAEFFAKITEDMPDFFEKWYSFKSLLIPSITCFEGQRVCTTDGRVTSCFFNQDLRDKDYDYISYSNSLSKVKVSAGVCHVCSYILDLGYPENYKDLERLAYTSIGLGLSYKFGYNLPEVLDHIKKLHAELISFKRLVDEIETYTENKVAVDVEYTSLQPYTQQAVYRMMNTLGIEVKRVSGMLADDMWSSDRDGEEVYVLSYNDFLHADFRYDAAIAIHSDGNFPARIWMFGRVSDIKDVLNEQNLEKVSPPNFRRIACQLPKVSYYINIQE